MWGNLLLERSGCDPRPDATGPPRVQHPDAQRELDQRDSHAQDDIPRWLVNWNDIQQLQGACGDFEDRREKRDERQPEDPAPAPDRAKAERHHERENGDEKDVDRQWMAIA